MPAHDPNTPQGYLMQALLGGIATAISHLSSTNKITSEYATATPKLIPTPDGSFIISHLRKYTSSQLSNFVISMANPHTYAMISTMGTPVKIRLPTTLTIASSHHQQIVHIQLNPHNRIIMGSAYAGLFQNPLIQSMNPSVPIPKVHQTKGLIGRKIEKMVWALTLLQVPKTLRTYEDFAREAAYEMEDTQPPATNPPFRRAKNHPTRPSRHMRIEIPNISQEGTFAGTTSMDVDQDLPEGTTPPLIPPRRRPHITPTRRRYLRGPTRRNTHKKLIHPLYTKSQETDLTTANTGHPTLQPPNTRLTTINEAEEEELTA